MRILLTGASGLIGSAVYAGLTEHDVIRLGRVGSNCDIFFDLTDLSNCPAFPSCDALVHCAGVVDEDFATGSVGNITKILRGAEELAIRAREAGAKYVFYVSSSHVYGKQEGVVDENSPPNPLSYYAIAHFCTEQIFRKIFSTDDCRVIVLRPNAVFGRLPSLRRFRRWNLIPFSFPLEAYAYGRITLRSSGEQMRNFVSSSAIAETICRELSLPLQAPPLINVIGVTTESVYSYAQRCADRFSKITGSKCAVVRPSIDIAAGSYESFFYASRFCCIDEIFSSNDHLDQLIQSLIQHGNWLIEQLKKTRDV